MRRHIDEDETPAVTRQRNRAADARHGFGSPEGMELIDYGTGQDGQAPQTHIQRFLRDDRKEQHFLHSLADTDSPPAIQTLSTESESPSPVALTAQSNRHTPPNVTDQLVRYEQSSPPRDTPDFGGTKPPPVTGSNRRRRGDQGVTFHAGPLFASPTPSNISSTSSASFRTQTMRPNSFVSPMARQALQTPQTVRTAASIGSLDPIQMGTPRSAVSGGSGFRGRLSDVTATPRDIDDSTSDSDTSVKERFSDQVKSLNTLLLSTGKRLGALGETTWSPDKDNDDLTQEEEDLEEIRRQLQQELSLVDYSVLKDSPSGSSAGSGLKSVPEGFPADEYSPFLAQESTPERNSLPITRASPSPHLPISASPIPHFPRDPYRSPSNSDHFSTPSATPSTTFCDSRFQSPFSPEGVGTSTQREQSSLGNIPQVSAQSNKSPSASVLGAIQDPRQTNSVTKPKHLHNQKAQGGAAGPTVVAGTHKNNNNRENSPPVGRDRSSNLSQSSSSSGRSAKSLLELLGFRSNPETSSRTPQNSGERREETQFNHFSDRSSSNSSRDADHEDMMSTSASEDSALERSQIFDHSELSENISDLEHMNHSSLQLVENANRQLDKDEDSSENVAHKKKSTPTLRREIAPEPPDAGRVTDSQQPMGPDHSVDTLRAKELLDSLDSIFFPGPITPTKPSVDKNITSSKKTKSAEIVDTSIESTSHAFPDDERQVPSGHKHQIEKNASVHPTTTTICMGILHDPPRFSSSNLATHPQDVKIIAPGNTAGYDDKVIGKDALQAEEVPLFTFKTKTLHGTARTKLKNSKRRKRVAGMLARATSGKRRFFGGKSSTDDFKPLFSPPVTPDKDDRKPTGVNSSLEQIGSTGTPGRDPLSPILNEDDELGPFQFSSATTSPRALFSGKNDVEEEKVAFNPSNMPSTYEDTAKSEDKGKKDAFPAKRHRFTSWLLCCIFLFVVVGVGIFVSVKLAGDFREQNHSPITLSPTISPTEVPQATSLPTEVSPSPSTTLTATPSTSPTVFPISFESTYKIIIANGLVEDVPQDAYKNDLIESMNRLLEIVIQKVPSAPKRLRRKLTAVLLPSDINRFKTTTCPQPDSRNRCEQVYAWITLQDAKDSWSDFKLVLELSIAMGQLQTELELVNPESPVAVLSFIENSEPSPATVELPVEGVTPSASPVVSLVPTQFDLFTFLVGNSFDGGAALMEQTSPQHQAYEWLLGNTFLSEYSRDRMLQRYALATFYFSTHGDSWFSNTSWLTDADECRWYSRSTIQPCDREGRLQGLELDYNNLNGALPPELGLLSSGLERLVLGGGPVSFTQGTIPSELGLLTKMTVFSMRGNRLSGAIPTELGQWTMLQQFDVARNQLSGPIPTEFGRFRNATLLDLSANRLTGALPSELGNMARCQRLDIGNNMLVGPIPSEFGNLRLLQSFQAPSNMLTSFPTELGRLTFLDTLSLFENKITGTLPSEMGRMRRLVLLELSNNAFTGTVPSQLGSLVDMRDRIDLSYNHLTGQLPSELGNLTRLRVFELNNNKISGTIPPELGALVRITTLSLESNDLVGTVPWELCNTFNQTYPAFSSDCSEFEDDCPCCTTCCVDNLGCQCRYIGTPQEFLCFQQKKS